MVKKLVILDFDGTIYDGDSMRDFARFLHPAKYRWSLIGIGLPYLLAKCKLMQMDLVKQQFLRIHFRGKKKAFLEGKGQPFFQQAHTKLFPSAVAVIVAQRDSGARCVVVSASCAEWLQPFCDHLQVELVCTQLEYDRNDEASGKWIGSNVKGQAKVVAIQSYLTLSDYDLIESFGNSHEDRILASISTNYYHRFFNRI